MGNAARKGEFADVTKFPHQDADPNASRSPCPMLNALANHGYLPRDGKNISPEQLTLALQERVGLSWPLSKVLVSGAFDVAHAKGRLDLSDLSKHGDGKNGGIEHDASLSRVDAALSNNHQADFNKERFEKLVSFSTDGQYLTVADLAAARNYFSDDSKKNNPQFSWSPQADRAAWGECVLITQVLGRDGKISVPDLRSFFEQEKFPQGWQKHPSFGIKEVRPYSNDVKSLAQKLHKAHDAAAQRP